MAQRFAFATDYQITRENEEGEYTIDLIIVGNVERTMEDEGISYTPEIDSVVPEGPGFDGFTDHEVKKLLEKLVEIAREIENESR